MDKTYASQGLERIFVPSGRRRKKHKNICSTRLWVMVIGVTSITSQTAISGLDSSYLL